MKLKIITDDEGNMKCVDENGDEVINVTAITAISGNSKKHNEAVIYIIY